MISNKVANAFGNCSITIIDIIHTGHFYADQYSSFTFSQWVESFVLSLMSKTISFRNNLLYLDYYEKQGNIPGQIQIVLSFIWELLWFENLYYGQSDEALMQGFVPP